MASNDQVVPEDISPDAALAQMIWLMRHEKKLNKPEASKGAQRNFLDNSLRTTPDTQESRRAGGQMRAPATQQQPTLIDAMIRMFSNMSPVDVGPRREPTSQNLSPTDMLMAMAGLMGMVGGPEEGGIANRLAVPEVQRAALGLARKGKDIWGPMLDAHITQAERLLSGPTSPGAGEMSKGGTFLIRPAEEMANRQSMAKLEGGLRELAGKIGGARGKKAIDLADQLRTRIKANLETGKLEEEMGHRKYAKGVAKKPLQEEEPHPMAHPQAAAEMLFREKPSGGFVLDPWNRALFAKLLTKGQAQDFVAQMAKWVEEKQSPALNDKAWMEERFRQPDTTSWQDPLWTTILKGILDAGK